MSPLFEKFGTRVDHKSIRVMGQMGKTDSSVVQPGIYQHYKDPNKRYLVFGVAKDTDSGEMSVLYIRLYDDPNLPLLFHRSVAKFMEEVPAPDHCHCATIPRYLPVDLKSVQLIRELTNPIKLVKLIAASLNLPLPALLEMSE